MKHHNPDITAYRRKKLRNLLIPTVIWCIIIAAFELTVFYDYTYDNLGIVTAIGLWILLSLIVPIRLGLIKYLFDASWEGTVARIEDHKRWAPNYGAGKWWYELEMYCQKPDGRMINKTITCVSKNAAIQKNTINPQMYHVGDRVVYLRGTYVPFIVHREGEVPPAVCVLCGKDNPAGSDTCLSCHAELLKSEEQIT
ncbi:MAG: hypothetical protein IJW77_09710 [Clostridia bacterium]|nr:hypothetical protein [Clostridia bacterium]